MDLGLKDRVAIVTGSSKGIGKAIALGLSEEGAKVVISARNETWLKKTAKEMHVATGGQVHAVPADLTKASNIKDLVAKTLERFGRIDVLVNNTGGPPSTTFSETMENQWIEAVDQLLMSVVTTCAEVIPHMRQRRWGRMINMTSFAAKQPAERLILSNTLRAGILGLSKTLSNELAKGGILVNAVCPGWTRTERVEELAKSKAKASGETINSIIQGWESQIPLGRLAEPKEIADLVVFLASERASYITGAVFQVDGGAIKALY